MEMNHEAAIKKVKPVKGMKTYIELPNKVRLIFDENGEYLGFYNPYLDKVLE